MNAQELFLLNPIETELKAQKASSPNSKIKAEQSNLLPPAAKTNSSKKLNKQFVPNPKLQASSGQLNSLVQQKNGQINPEAPHIKRCRQAIRSFCMECQGRLSHAVDACEDHDCKLYPFRKAVAENLELFHNTKEKPVRAVRQHCLICCGGERGEVRNCAAGKTCALWPFRFGVNPTIYRKVKEKWRGPKHYALPGL